MTNTCLTIENKPDIKFFYDPSFRKFYINQNKIINYGPQKERMAFSRKDKDKAKERQMPSVPHSIQEP